MTTQQKPGWVTAVAIIGIILSGFGVMGALQEAMTPVMIEAQKAQYAQVSAQFEQMIQEMEKLDETANSPVLDMIRKFHTLFQKIMNMPEWFQSWSVIAGLLGIFINGAYLTGAILLLRLKPRGLTLLYLFLPLSIALGITRTLVSVSAFGDGAYYLMGGTLVAAMIEGVLFLTLLRANKSVFYPFQA